MKQQEIIEKIISDIRNNKYKIGEKIPTEKELIKIFFCSKETVRKAILKLVNQNILFSIQGKGVFVSQFSNLNFDIKSIISNLKLNSYSRHPISYEIPQIVKKNFPFVFNYENEKFLKYIKLYFRDNKIIFYTINWVCKQNLNLTEKELIKNGKKYFFENNIIKKIYQKSILTKATKFDKSLFNSEKEYYPTIFYYYFDKNEEFLGISLIKIFPNYYQIDQIKMI
ncbi:MAG: GntR family transcriptional regulator [Candidatus Hepatoplasma scabrum]|nr:MAG: GntR family transcriptional regulator [Candidatus Hepatoplasma sp.]